jgi:hypothetical protein
LYAVLWWEVLPFALTIATSQLLRVLGIRQSQILVIVLGLPFVAAAVGWLLAGRQPSGM